MFLISSISREKKDLDYKKMIICPSCLAYGNLEVYSSYNCLKLFFLPVFSWDKKYYARISCCQTGFSLDKDLGSQLEKDLDINLGPEDLQEEREKKNICETCGEDLRQSYSFCPYCGGRIR